MGAPRGWIVQALLALWCACQGVQSAEPNNPMVGCCHGQRLIVALEGVDEHPFFDFKTHPVALNTTLPLDELTGFIPDLLHDLADKMGTDLSYYTIDPSLTDADLTQFTENLLVEGTADAVFTFGLGADSFGHAALGGAFAFSATVYNSPISGVVKLQKHSKTIWAFVDPFSGGLWGAVAIAVTFVGVCILVLKSIKEVDEGASLGEALRQMGRGFTGFSGLTGLADALYASLAVFLAGDIYEWDSHPERVLRSGWLFFCLIVISSYTANLAAFFTQPNVSIHSPPSGMQDLIYATACTTMITSRDDDSPLQFYVKSFIHPSPECKPWSQCATDFCYNAVQDGTVDVWLDDQDALHAYVLDQSLCDTLMELPEVRFLPFFASTYFKLNHSNWEFAGNLSSAIVHENNSPRYLELMDKYYRLHDVCNSANSSDQITFTQMKGLFYVTGLIAIASLLHAVLMTVRRVRGGGKPLDAETTPSQPLSAMDDPTKVFMQQVTKNIEQSLEDMLLTRSVYGSAEGVVRSDSQKLAMGSRNKHRPMNLETS
uniref:Ionotropic glutamate receptor C-terminal domain-containing protein n=1 Tax=Pyramimonas obovata TaxID=1411642 RepID=A0A7S0R782_9CHLO|mmetsp:Transcript_27342/g.59741  ORF Transcript_27342/g.59741 Transcript_27342/m.59741 type:complete len:544 (+) Transcript_27342:80-1711(+)